MTDNNEISTLTDEQRECRQDEQAVALYKHVKELGQLKYDSGSTYQDGIC